MHSIADENLGLIKPNQMDSVDIGGVDHCISNVLKRKCYFDLSTNDHSPSKSFKRSYEQCVPNNKFTTDIYTEQQHSVPESETVGNCENNQNHHQSVEYVNIMYDSNLMPIENGTVITEANFVNYSNTELDTTWNNVELLDLDQRNYYYSEIQQHPGHHETRGGTIEEHHRSEISKQNSDEDLTVPSNQEDSDDRNLSWLLNYKLDELPHLSPEVNRSRIETGLKVDEIIQEATAAEIDECDIVVAENVTVENTQKLPKKPPFTYTELIEYALEDRGELTVSGIYQWISDRFPFYKTNDDRWKNSVRHNLSINPHFRKGSKAAQGAGHLWTISTRDSESNVLAWEHKKQRLELFFKMENQSSLNPPTNESPTSLADEAVIAASNLELINRSISSESPEIVNQQHQNSSPSIYQQQIKPTDDLKRSAEEILNGIRRTVEVQVINQTPCNYQSNALSESDYLNPVPKEQIVRECGLRSGRNEIGNDFFITEIDPIELGVNMNVNDDEEILFGDEFNLNYFGIIPGNNIMA